MEAQFLQVEEYGKSKTRAFITDYLTIFTRNLVGLAEQTR